MPRLCYPVTSTYYSREPPFQAVFAFVAGTDSDEYRTKFWKLSHHPLQKKLKQWIKKIRFYRKSGTPA